ncbi:glycogen debranching enzyme [Pyrenophora seminiperda CCB06]|uniref:Glycogen debranching enzyme n=1 Tax=Pyrenophora seminiperda CCB06 TaxID=1302712 RepID=A0A3M7M5U7_9PLEO|nr:glycogen debranching enzyme [Pyrenophora seminiperda CCB06]
MHTVMVALSLLTIVALLVVVLAFDGSRYSAPPSTPAPTFPTAACTEAASRLHLQGGPHDNHFYSDCHTSVHVILTSPEPDSNLNVVKPRLLVAWPAGNSGAMALFAPENGKAGSLSMNLEQSDDGQALQALNAADHVGVSGKITFNTAARLTVPILGSIRSIRDFTEGGSINQDFQGSFCFNLQDGGASINRTWFDGVTTTTLKFTPLNGAQAIVLNRDAAWTLTFGAGTYSFEASFNYPQLEQLSPVEVLNSASTGLISQNPDQTTSLSFLSYSNKLLAGTWRFLTYFGRDSMLSLLLMQPILSEVAIEAVIGAVLERVKRSDGTVCHEEVLGDYSTWLNWKNGVRSTAPSCDYKMIDTDFYLPIAMKSYFVDTDSGKNRSDGFFSKTATFLAENNGLKYSQLAQLTAEKIMRNAAPFAGSQVKDNLIHLNSGAPVGEWRDSNNGLGGGRIPYDVNTALVPAGLRAIASLSKAGYFADHPDWSTLADQYAQIWEDETLRFFEVTVPESQAKSLVQSYVSSANLGVPSNADKIKGDITYYGLALDGTLNTPVVPVMNTDDCFRHFLLDTQNETQLTAYISQTADHILQPFPVGLSSDVGLFVANPAYSGDSGFAGGFSKTDYHGTVVWSWQLAMMGAGLARQLRRCKSNDIPDFCKNSAVHSKVISAYNHLWSTIDTNRDQLGHEVWSWSYDNGFKVAQLGDLTSTESNIRQLWSLTFLAVKKEDF